MMHPLLTLRSDAPCIETVRCDVPCIEIVICNAPCIETVRCNAPCIETASDVIHFVLRLPQVHPMFCDCL